MKKAILVAAIMILSLSTSVFAGPNFNAKAWIHLEDHASRTCAKGFPTGIDSCDDIVYTLAGADADCFPVFWDLVEYQGFDYGLTWPGAYTAAFTSCSDLAIGTIVNPGDGVSHAWYVCQNSTIAIPGWAWIYDTGPVCIISHPTAGGVVVGACNPTVGALVTGDWKTELGVALDTLPPISYGCSGIGGYVVGDGNPCDAAIAPTSWGGIKGMFR
jgi:hypothetical protein